MIKPKRHLYVKPCARYFKMASWGSSSFFLHGFVTLCIVTGTIITMIAIFTEYWVEPSVGTGLVKAGLWKVCFYKHRFHKTAFDVKYLDLSGCYEYTNEVFKDIQNWIHPPWLISVKGLLVGGLVSNVITLYCSAFYVLFHRYMFLGFSVGFCWMSSVLISAGTTMFYYNAFDPYWLPMPSSNHLSWSYRCSLASTFIMSIGAILHLIQGIVIYRNKAQ